MMVLDTHVLIWLVEGDRRLGAHGREAVDKRCRDGQVLVSAITPWEIAMLVHKGRLALAQELGIWLGVVLSQPGIALAPIEPEIAVDSVRLPGTFRADPSDRLIIATARHAGVPLLTADRAILDYGASGHVAVIDANR